jgi:rhamnulose-1-phosphate aldolase
MAAGKTPIRRPALERHLRDLKETSALLWKKGWAESNAGNLSMDVTEAFAGAAPRVKGSETPFARNEGYSGMAGRLLLVTGTGCLFRDISSDAPSGTCLLKVNGDGMGFRSAQMAGARQVLKPTSELASHMLVHETLRRSGSKMRVVLHTHPTEMIALSLVPGFKSQSSLNGVLWATMPEVKVALPEGAGLAKYLLPGSESLAVRTAALVERGHRLVIWAKHGCLAIGSSAMDAFDTIDTLNKAADIALKCLMAGHRPQGLTKADLRELEMAFNL